MKNIKNKLFVNNIKFYSTITNSINNDSMIDMMFTSIDNPNGNGFQNKDNAVLDKNHDISTQYQDITLRQLVSNARREAFIIKNKSKSINNASHVVVSDGNTDSLFMSTAQTIFNYITEYVSSSNIEKENNELSNKSSVSVERQLIELSRAVNKHNNWEYGLAIVTGTLAATNELAKQRMK